MPLAEYLQIHPAGAECPAGANYFLNLEGVAIESSPSFGKKPEPKNMTLFGFRKEDDMDEHWSPRVVRTYDVIPGSEHTLEASGRDIAAVKAVLLVNAVCTVKPEPNFRALVKEAGEAIGPVFGDRDGLIVKHFLCSRWGDKNIGGGLYFFESIESVESYLSSEFWEGVLKDTEWDNDTLKYELYRVGDLPLVA